MSTAQSDNGPRKRRPRYQGTHPRHFDEKYKELDPAGFPTMQQHVRAQGRTPAGTHVPIMTAEVLECLSPRSGDVVVDCTLGFGGHALDFCRGIAPGGVLIGLDVDGVQLCRARDRIERELGENADGAAPVVRFHSVRSNFAGLPGALAEAQVEGAEIVFADLGLSSMQVDDPARGFSYKHDGPLDMRMDERIARSAADWLQVLPAVELARMFREHADEPEAAAIAEAIVAQRQTRPIRRTLDLVRLIERVIPADGRHAPKEGSRGAHGAGLRSAGAGTPSAARVFQALRIKVNDELGALAQLLRVLPACLRAGGRAAVLTFHSGEDRLVKRAFQEGVEKGVYRATNAEVLRASAAEVRDNPRAASAKLRWVERAQATAAD